MTTGDEVPELFGALRAGPDAPVGLEQRVRDDLRAKGVLRARRPGASWRPVAMAALAACAAFLLGRGSVTRSDGAPVGTQWMLLLYEDSSFAGPGPGAEASYVEEYHAWGAELRRRGAMVDGAELAPGGARFVRGSGVLVAGEPVPDHSGRLTGYFVVAAPTFDAAARIAATSPHLRHHGTVVIRPIGAS